MLSVQAEATWGTFYFGGSLDSNGGGKANAILGVSVTDNGGAPRKGLAAGNFAVHFLPAPGFNPKFLPVSILVCNEDAPGVYTLGLVPPACPDVGERFLYSVAVTSKSSGSKAADHGQTVTWMDLPAGV